MSKKAKPQAATTQTTPTASSPFSSSAPPKKKGKIDPQILELRKKHRAEMDQFIQTRSSGERLERLIKREIPKLTVKDQEKLRDHMDQITTPRLPMTDPEPTMTEARKPEPEQQEVEESPWPAEMAEI